MIKHGLALLLLLFVIPTQVCAADEINILTPEHEIRVNYQTVWLVAMTTPEPIDMVALLKNKGTVKKIKGKVLKKDEAFAFHALLSLETGLNEVTVGGKSLSIFYRPRYQLVDKSTGKEKVFQDYPRYFFHTPQKEARCSQCHAMDRLKAQPKPDCSQCHAELTSVKYLHGPLGGGVCFVCHDPDSAPSSFAPRFDGARELCFGCHDKAKKAFENIQGKETYFHCAVRDFPCTTCHNPHGSPFKFQLPVEEKRMCYLCHEEKKIAGGKFVHKVLESEGCVACHDPHTSNYKGHLADAEQALCSQAECHPQFAKITEGHPIETHPVTGMFGPERKLSCSGCHNPHSSDFPFLLPGEKHSFCAKCHDDMRFLLDSDRPLSW